MTGIGTTFDRNYKPSVYGAATITVQFHQSLVAHRRFDETIHFIALDQAGFDAELFCLGLKTSGERLFCPGVPPDRVKVLRDGFAAPREKSPSEQRANDVSV